jgi:hypothetical protein
MKQLKLSYPVIFVVINLVISSCADPKISQCQKMISFVNQTATETKTLTNNQSEKNYQPWLQAADKMEESAQEMAKILIFDSQLKEYQQGFVQMYSDYAESTREIIKARQNKALNQALIAQEKVKKASQLEQELGNNINNYCLN